MDFSFSEDQRMIFEEARRVAMSELAPRVQVLDEKGEVNHKALSLMGELGFMGMTVPAEFGGSAVGTIAYAGSLLEFSKADAGTSVALSVHNSLVNESILKFGSDLQKQEYLPNLASGKWLGCFSLSESDAGSDPGSMKMTAANQNGSYILNGTKNFTTSGAIADVIVVFAQTAKGKGSNGVSAFILRNDTPGFKPGKHENKMGIRSSNTCELVFDNCRIPADALLGEENQGLKVALATLDNGRIGIAAQAIGIAEAAYEEAQKYAKDRVQFGRKIIEFQAIHFMLVDMATEIEVAKTMLYRVAWMKDSSDSRFTKEGAMLKLFASEMSHRVCHKALQIHGGYGYIKEYPIERLYRDQRITEIYEGTSEIQRHVIARQLFKDLITD